jgi:hypothetical protein
VYDSAVRSPLGFILLGKQNPSSLCLFSAVLLLYRQVTQQHNLLSSPGTTVAGDSRSPISAKDEVIAVRWYARAQSIGYKENNEGRE